MDVTSIGIAQALSLIPSCLKFILAMPSDKLRLRRPFIVLGLIISSGSFFSMTAFNPTTYFALYCFIMIMRNVGAGFADGASEGLSVDCNLQEKSGLLSSAMQIGRMSGLIGGAALGGFLVSINWTAVLIFMGVTVLAIIPIVLFMKEELSRNPEDDVAKFQPLPTAGSSSSLVDPSSAKVVANPFMKAESQSETPAPVEGGGSEPSTPSGSGELSPTPKEGALLVEPAKNPDYYDENGNELTERQILIKLCKTVPVANFLSYVFITNLGTYIASFPIVLWLQNNHDFSVAEVGWVTVVSGISNLAASILTGYAFDYFTSKRMVLFFTTLLAGGSYLAFIPASGRFLVYLSQVFVSMGIGALYTVQISLVRLLADERIGGSFFGVVLSVLNVAALIGTAAGGPIAESNYNTCYYVGCVICLVGVVNLPWITTKFSTDKAIEEELHEAGIDEVSSTDLEQAEQEVMDGSLKKFKIKQGSMRWIKKKERTGVSRYIPERVHEFFGNGLDQDTQRTVETTKSVSSGSNKLLVPQTPDSTAARQARIAQINATAAKNGMGDPSNVGGVSLNPVASALSAAEQEDPEAVRRMRVTQMALSPAISPRTSFSTDPVPTVVEKGNPF
jgi:MFS family permease